MTPAEVKRIRESLGLNKREFGERIGVTDATVSRWENSTRPVSKPYPILIRAVAQGIELPR